MWVVSLKTWIKFMVAIGKSLDKTGRRQKVATLTTTCACMLQWHQRYGCVLSAHSDPCVQCLRTVWKKRSFSNHDITFCLLFRSNKQQTASCTQSGKSIPTNIHITSTFAWSVFVQNWLHPMKVTNWCFSFVTLNLGQLCASYRSGAGTIDWCDEWTWIGIDLMKLWHP